MRNAKLILGGLAVIIIIGIILFAGDRKQTTEIASDTTIEGDYSIASDERVVLKDNATLAVTGNATLDGELTCENGSLNLVVEGDLTVNENLSCEAGDSDTATGDILIVAQGSVAINDSATVESDGTVQIVESANRLALTDEALEEAFTEAGSVACEGVCIGPFPGEDSTQSALLPSSATKNKAVADTVSTPSKTLIPVAHAQVTPVGDTVIVSGKWVVKKPKKKQRSILLFYVPGAKQLILKDLTMTVPEGDPGTDDLNKSCDAEGVHGRKAGRLLFWGPEVKVNNVTLNLGDGGRGGDAETKTDCYPKAVAQGGAGGESGNLKIVASASIDIEGAFTIYPGAGGKGGDATATAADAPGPSLPGGDAVATGGAGADNTKKLSVKGNVSGLGNVQIASMIGGDGGDATASPGNGGDGIGCGNDGGRGGHGTAVGGKGGDATIDPAIPGTPDTMDRGGDGGDVKGTGGQGGEGGDCGPQGPGGNGGDGGNASSTPGAGGASLTNGENGIVINEQGGNGGNGGNGCPEGQGGDGGQGNPPGKDGQPGKNLCVEQAEDTTGTIPSPEPEETAQQPDEEEQQVATTATMSFEHVVPGEFSEVYVTVNTQAGAQVQATLSGPGVDSAATQSATANAEGVANFTWRIVSFGTYSVSGTAGQATFSSSVNVQ